MNFAVAQNALARLQRAQAQQLMALTSQRYSVPASTGMMLAPVDTVTLGAPRFDAGLMPSPQQLARDNGINAGSIPLSSDPDFWKKWDATYMPLLDKIALLKALEASQGAKSGSEGNASASKGDLNVVAGNRKDGVKAKKVTIHESGRWSTRQWDENRADYREHESKFENAQVGQYYWVNVEWEDGTTPRREVQMTEPGQTVYMDTPY